MIGDKADALQRVPGSGTVVGSKDLERAAPVDVAEMLRRVPGVQVRQDTGGGNRIDISVRGLDGGRSRRVLILEDGVPVALNPYSEPDMYYAPPIERMRGIEVVKGSGNILFGPQTLAGTINFLTVTPPDRPTAVADVDVGTYGYARGYARYGDAFHGARWVVQLLHRRGDGFRALPFEQTNLLAKLAVPTSAHGELVLKLGFHGDQTASDDVGLTRAMYAATPRRGSLSPDSQVQLGRYDVSLIHDERFSETTKLKTIVYAYRTQRDWRRQEYTRAAVAGERFLRVVGDGDPGGTIWFGAGNTVLDREHDVLGAEPRLEHRFRTAGVAHTLEAGGRVLRETASYQLRNGSYPETYAGSLQSVERRYGTAFAGYAQDRIAFRDDVLLTPGIRVEHLAMRRVTLRQGDDVYLAGESSVTGVVPGVGMVVGTKTSHVFGGLHVGFAPPRVSSAISARGETTLLKGDKSINYELGTRLTRGPLRAELTGFLSNFQNQVIVSSAASGDAVLTDAGATNLAGAESAGLLQLGRVLRLPTVIDLGARYTYARSTFRYGPNAGSFLPYAPEHSLNANLDVEQPVTGGPLGTGALGGQVAWAFVGRQFADAANTVAEDVTGRIGELPARHVVDATVHYRHARSGLSLRLTAKNAFDTTYVISRRPEGIFTGPYRQVLLGLRWEWEGRARD